MEQVRATEQPVSSTDTQRLKQTYIRCARQLLKLKFMSGFFFCLSLLVPAFRLHLHTATHLQLNRRHP
jgi:hypothetical protein